jgi:ATP-binding protein involved in chromosome partitioning
MFAPMPMPVEIVGLLRSTITFVWEDEHKSVFPARELRLACRCASCIEEMTGKPLLDPKVVPDSVRARAMRIIGNYAVNIDWSDGHSTGLYNFRALRESCPCDACKALRAAGKTPG